MGTKSLTAVKINNEYKIAQFGWYDGYPLGHGLLALKFLISMDKEKFLKKLKKVRFAINNEEADKLSKEQEQYEGAKILNYINDNKGYILKNYLDFAKKDMLCEWVYLINFDKNIFEIYSKYKFSRKYINAEKENEFKKMNLLKRYNLNQLPSEEDFTEIFDIN